MKSYLFCKYGSTLSSSIIALLRTVAMFVFVRPLSIVHTYYAGTIAWLQIIIIRYLVPLPPHYSNSGNVSWIVVV